MPLGGKPGQRNAPATHGGDEGSWLVKQVNAGMLREAEVRNAPALVIPRHHEHRNAPVGDARQWLEGLIGKAGGGPGAIEDVAAVHHDVDLSGERRRQRGRIVGEEIVATATTPDACLHRQVEAEVRVGKQENPDDVGHLANLRAVMARVVWEKANCQSRCRGT